MEQELITALKKAITYLKTGFCAAVKTMEENPSALEVAEAARELRAFATVMIRKIEREKDVF